MLAVDTPSAWDRTWNTILSMWHGFLDSLPLLIGAVIVLLLTWGLSALVKRWMARLLDRFDIRDSLKRLLNRLTRIALWIAGILIAAMIVFPNLTPASALTALGLGSIAVGFAFKDIFENFFAGILILWRFPLEPGDWIEIEGEHASGRVEDVTIRHTLIRTVADELIVVPNSVLYKNPVKVLTNRPTRRELIIAGIDYDDDIEAAREAIRRALDSCQTVSEDRELQIFVHQLNSSSVDFEVAWWTRPSPLETRQSRDEVITAIKRELDQAGITIPFPQRTLSFRDAVQIEQKGKGGEGGEDEGDRGDDDSDGGDGGQSGQAPQRNPDN